MLWLRILITSCIVEDLLAQSRSRRVKRDDDDDGQNGKFGRWLKKIEYDKGTEPENSDGTPVNVNISVLISNIRSISEINMEYSVEMFFREYWRDSRLLYDINDWNNKSKISLSEAVAKDIWQPDSFIPNALSSGHPEEGSISHRALYRLDSDGKVAKSSRYSIVAECNLDLTRYPFDTQVCKLGFESYGYTTAQVDYFWVNGSSALEFSKIRLPDFEISNAFVTKKVFRYATGDYSRLYACFVFERSAGYCFLQLIMPSLAVVFTAWVSMWMDNESSFQDMITIILAIIFLLYSYNESMPKVSYIKAMDVYLGICFAVAFFSLLKIAFTNYTKKVIEGRRESEDQRYTSTRERKNMVTVRSSWIFNEKFLKAFNMVTTSAMLVFFLGFCVLFFFVYPFLMVKIEDSDCNIDEAIFVVKL